MDRTAPGRPPTVIQDALRYRVALVTSGPAVSLTVRDRVSGQVLRAWQGAVVEHLLEAGIVPRDWCGGDPRVCGKHFVQHLALAGAAATLAIRQMRDGHQRAVPAARVATQLPPDDGRATIRPRWVARDRNYKAR